MLDAEIGLAQVQIEQGHAAAANAQFRTAMALIDSQRSKLIREEYKLSYLASLMETYEKYVDFLVPKDSRRKRSKLPNRVVPACSMRNCKPVVAPDRR